MQPTTNKPTVQQGAKPGAKPAPAKPAQKPAAQAKPAQKPATAKKTAAAAKPAKKPKPPAEKPAPMPKIGAGKAVKNVPLKDIVADVSKMQAREKISDRKVKEYAGLMKDGVKFPDIDVFKVDGKYILSDGFHRLLAMQKNGDVTTSVNLHPGGKREALFFALGANSNHGLGRTTEDKKRAVHALLTDPEWSKCSDRELSKHAGVSNVMVSKYRKTLKRNHGESVEESNKGSKGGRLRLKLTGPEQTQLDDHLSKIRNELVAFSKKVTSNPESEFIKRLLNAEVRTVIADTTMGKPAEPKRKIHPNNTAKK